MYISWQMLNDFLLSFMLILKYTTTIIIFYAKIMFIGLPSPSLTIRDEHEDEKKESRLEDKKNI